MSHRSILDALRRLHDLLKAINSSLEIADIETVLIPQTSRLMRTDAVAILRCENGGGTLRIHRLAGLDQTQIAIRLFRNVRSFEHCIVHTIQVII
jgi:hypothetical protein